MVLLNKRSLPMVLLVGLMLAAFLRVSPLQRPVPGRDAGIYLYTGQQLLNGALPYRDVWDNRPPGLFYVSALGLWLGRGSIWGVWLIEAAMLCAAVVLSYRTLLSIVRPEAAFLATFLWIVTLVLMYDFDIAEEYGLLFQFIAVYSFVRAHQRGRYGGYGVAIGASLAAAINFRQNMVGVWAVIVLLVLIESAVRREPLAAARALLSMAAGVALIFVPIIVYFGAIGVLGLMWDGAYVFNFIYVSTSWSNRFDTLAMGVDFLARSGLLLVALAGWIMAVYAQWRRRSTSDQPLIIAAIIGLPVELVLSSLSGRPFQHYFISTLPVLAVLAALFFDTLLALAQKAFARGSRRPSTTVFVGGLALASCLVSLQIYFTPTNPIYTWSGLRGQAIDFIVDNTRPDDTVLVWGAEAMLNLQSGRRSPTHLTNNYPLFMPGYQSPAMMQAYVDELRRNPPAYIVDTAYTNGLFSPIDPTGRADWAANKANDSRRAALVEDFRPLPAMSLFFDFVDQNYHTDKRLGRWIFYVRNDYQPPNQGVSK